MAMGGSAQSGPRRRRELGDFVKLGRSSADSFYRAHLAKENIKPSAPVFVKLASFLSIQFLFRAWKFVKCFFRFRYEFQDYRAAGETGIFPMTCDAHSAEPENVSDIRISLAGDWGTGTEEAELVAKNILESHPHYTIHLGDVYYVGGWREINEHCLNTAVPGNGFTPVEWPHGTAGSFALVGNHEMYANGTGYFKLFLPTLGIGQPGGPVLKHQRASFFCLKNEHWMILGIDTGYNSAGWASLFSLCKLEDKLMTWIEERVRLQDFRGAIVLLGHHQYFSRFEGEYPRPAQQLSKILNDRAVLWFWGHEHRLAIYGRYKTKGGISAFGRCVGHGGMPVSLGTPSKNGPEPLVLYDNRVYANLAGTNVGFNGWANLTFSGPKLCVNYLTLGEPPKGKPTLLAAECWQSQNGEPKGTNIDKIHGMTQMVTNIQMAQR
jgi:Calcineurin-like phosphoesterase